MKDVTGAPVRYVGIGETLDTFAEEFRADAQRLRQPCVLGMGDVVGLMKDFEQVVDEKDAAEKAMKMLEGQFTLDDFLEQIRMIQKMGSLKRPHREDARHGRHDPAGREPRRQGARACRGDHPVAHEVRAPRPLTPSSASRRGAQRVTKRAPASPRRRSMSSSRSSSSMKQMMDGMGQNLGMMGKVPGLKNVAMAKQMRKQMAQGGMPGMGRISRHARHGRLPGMPGMGFPGMGGLPRHGIAGRRQPRPRASRRRRTLSTAEKNARKAARKREKDARKKSRR